MKMEQSVPKRRHIKLRRKRITQKKTHNNSNVISNISCLFAETAFNSKGYKILDNTFGLVCICGILYVNKGYTLIQVYASGKDSRPLT
jgi:divalent metal cation (Fe/Co/Zn/Cd) transporter